MFQLRWRCRSVLRGLGVVQPLELGDLVARLGSSRGRPIRLVSREAPLGSFGCLIPMANEDLVVYHSASEGERNHIVYHELAHLFLDHVGGEPEANLTLMCGFEPEDEGADPAASLYDARVEWEAETAATILSQWSAPAAPARRPDPAGDPVLDRLDRAFEDLRRWR